MPSILFVCLGNMCRSPLAAAALRDEARRCGVDLIVDSARTVMGRTNQAPVEKITKLAIIAT